VNVDNVAQLGQIIDRYADNFPDEPRVRVLQMAQWLASCGVLIPNALTREQVANLCDCPPEHAHYRRDELAKLAKGKA
jgi:hypothetical protein